MAEAAKDQIEVACEEFRKLKKTCFVVGYTGGAGKSLVEELVEANVYQKVLLLGRRKVHLPDNDKYTNVEQRIINFENLEENLADFSGCDVGYSCLGVPAQHPKEEYIKVNYDHIVNTAKTAKSAGCREFYLLSGMGVDHKSRFFHMRTKGEAEEAVKACDFERCSVFRPGILDIKREQKRRGEEVMKFFAVPLRWVAGSKFYMPIQTLAKAMVYDSVRTTEVKVNVYENSDICKLAESKDPFQK